MDDEGTWWMFITLAKGRKASSMVLAILAFQLRRYSLLFC
jgi:hypothetical protein